MGIWGGKAWYRNMNCRTFREWNSEKKEEGTKAVNEPDRAGSVTTPLIGN